jgi:hypothetical protein
MLKAGVVRIDFNLREQTNDVSLAVRLAQGVLERLHQEVGDSALTVRHADVQRHRDDALARKRLAEQDLPDNGPVPVRDDEFVIQSHEGQQGFGGRRHDVELLLRRSDDAVRVDGVSTDRDQ